MQWHCLTEQHEQPGGVLEIEPSPDAPGLELQVFVIGGMTVVAWVTESGALLASGQAWKA